MEKQKWNIHCSLIDQGLKKHPQCNSKRTSEQASIRIRNHSENILSVWWHIRMDYTMREREIPLWGWSFFLSFPNLHPCQLFTPSITICNLCVIFEHHLSHFFPLSSLSLSSPRNFCGDFVSLSQPIPILFCLPMILVCGVSFHKVAPVLFLASSHFPNSTQYTRANQAANSIRTSERTNERF